MVGRALEDNFFTHHAIKKAEEPLNVDIHGTVHRYIISIVKPSRCTIFRV